MTSIGRLSLVISLSLNALVALPVIALLCSSATVRSHVYQEVLAKRLGRPEIVFVGDSITAYGGIWAFRLGRFDLSTWNLAQAGSSTRQILERQVRPIAHERPRVAFVMAGINDEDKSRSGAERSFGYYREMLDVLRTAGTEPVIQLTLYRQNETDPDFVDNLNGMLRAYAAATGLSVVDLNPVLCRDRSLRPEFSRDGVHLTEAAYRLWAAELRNVLAERENRRPERPSTEALAR